MFKKSLICATFLVACAGGTTAVASSDSQQNWDLTPLYTDWQQWQQQKETLTRDMQQLAQFKGQLGSGAGQLADALDLYYDLAKTLSQLSVYANLNADTDLRNSDNGAKRQSMNMLSNQFDQVSAFIKPELIALGDASVEAMIKQEPRLQPYRFPLQDILRAKDHTLSPQTEQIMAATGALTGSPYSSYATFTNAELPWPQVELDGDSVTLNQANYAKYRSHGDRAVRQQAFDQFFGTLSQYRRTIASMLDANVKADVFNAQSRHYDSALESALAQDNIPVEVYNALVDTTNANLDTLQRYLKLRARLLKLEDQQYFDIYTPVVKATRSYPIDTGIQMMLDSLAPMGESYVNNIRIGLKQRWMDTYPKTGKRSGAYMSGSAYDVHPYVLMNYNDDYSSVSTLTHEWGHANHSVFANGAQPYSTAAYATFTAEIASTFQEHLLTDYALANAKDDAEKLYFLGQTLETFRGTFFRQTMFAEFERAIHETVESGEPLSDTKASALFLDLLRRYHGHDQGVMTIDEDYGIEWAYVPHFYYNFYVYQYATSIAASAAFADEVLSGDRAAYDRYLALLKSGGSDYPYDLVKRAGVDLATAAPYEAIFARMNRLMDEMEIILNRQP
ncbi:oligopeptidase F. Metallo peptidase. MEROPS family M03B [Ferrimonas sediminum]|uniref:Oligopeptidase F n=1 Tax=Ferrimonas sediminum TaxID=718193 RepID=A0A1G8W3L7_9GAMM|nr:oligoendopeptidase F [Ferrimonas sediminum]SDJ72663.1 oligopeptidase F. Metallo peptidase. MEROPS family M03B [Ferrimonas sediminum]